VSPWGAAFLAAWLVGFSAAPADAQGWQHYLDGYHGPYRGRVIDAETQRPLAGAVVVAVWSRVRTFPLHSSTVYYEAREVLTNADGRFILHAKELEERAPDKTLRPTFIIFAPGYGWFPQFHTSPQGFTGGIFEGSGVTVELPRLKTRQERLDAVRPLPPSVSEGKIPHLLRLLNTERLGLGLQPVGPEAR
jgi:hypothetical protein